MTNKETFWIKIAFAAAAGLIAGAILRDAAVGFAAFAVFSLVAWIPLYIKYSQDNPEGLWFRRKMFGWGWTPVTWQGWLVVGIYVALIAAFAATIDRDSPVRETIFTFWIPTAALTALLIRICYRKGEKPRWEWGRNVRKYMDK